MKPLQRILVILLALASLGTTLLIMLVVSADGPVASAAGRAGTFEEAVAEGPRAGRGGVIESAEAGALPVLGALPEFALVDHRGEALTPETMQGTPWVVDFVFTRCSGPCPRMTSRMAGLQGELEAAGASTRLLSVSVDPDHDSPEVLAEYARLARADPERWRFATGEREALWSLVAEGFRLPVAERDDPEEPIVHSQKFVLLDAQLRIRGYYDALEPEARRRLISDLAGLGGGRGDG